MTSWYQLYIIQCLTAKNVLTDTLSEFNSSSPPPPHPRRPPPPSPLCPLFLFFIILQGSSFTVYFPFKYSERIRFFRGHCPSLRPVGQYGLY